MDLEYLRWVRENQPLRKVCLCDFLCPPELESAAAMAVVGE